jgi:hypothetical protein
MTTFALLCDRCGLSHREAAAFLGVRLDTVKSWSAGRNPAPEGVLAQLRGLYARIAQAAEQAIQVIEDNEDHPDELELGLAADDHEAQSLGWPCVGAHRAVLGLVAALCPDDIRVVIVPRGSTMATAGAADIHEQ